jgi:WhiB family transcriptional regulator, redox-sensing transcriptional regulator
MERTGACLAGAPLATDRQRSETEQKAAKGTTMADTRRLPEPLLDYWDWQLAAACRGMDIATFYHPRAERNPSRERRIATAKAICNACPAINECLAHALRVQEPYGIWGGVSEDERAAMLGVASLQYPARIKEDASTS